MTEINRKNEPIDGEYGLDYQIYILRQMVEQLPEDIRQLIHKQIDEVILALGNKQKLMLNQLIPKLQDVMLDVNYLEFDRYAIAKERDEAKLNHLLTSEERTALADVVSDFDQLIEAVGIDNVKEEAVQMNEILRKLLERSKDK